MLVKNNKGYYTLTSFSPFKSLVHGFSTTDFGNMKGDLKNQKTFLKTLGVKAPSVVRAEQIHLNKIVLVKQKDADERIEGVDGLVTSVNRLYLTICVADCLPILVFDQKNPAVGIAHAGWKGTVAGIAKNLIKKFTREFGSNPKDLLVGFGPCIEFCHYDIDRERVAKIKKAGLVEALFKSVSGKTSFDLRGANIKQLLSVGILRSNIDMSIKACTYEIGDFYSWRRERPNLSGEIVAIVGLKDG